MQAYSAEPWSDFATAAAGAAAALAGLLFVAVSINLAVIVRGTYLPDRAAQALILLVTPVFLALAVLVPGQGPAALGVELIVVGAVVGPVLAWLSRPSHRDGAQPLAAWVGVGLVPAAVLLVAPVTGGIGLLTGSAGGLYWLPVAVAVALLGGLFNAWALLIEILR